MLKEASTSWYECLQDFIIENDLKIGTIYTTLFTKNLHGDICWGLILKCFELRTRQHKMLNVNNLRPLKHYLLRDTMHFGQRS
jgi:hypothetical protein